jgi:hypothetical protein
MAVYFNLGLVTRERDARSRALPASERSASYSMASTSRSRSSNRTLSPVAGYWACGRMA